MLPFQSYYAFDAKSYSNQEYGFAQKPGNSSVNIMDGGESVLSSTSKVERKLSEACKSHKEAERRRRQRINAHLSTLRTLLPSTTKTDKASLLAEVVHHLKELRRQAADVARQDGDGGCGGSGGLKAQQWLFPGESDEATLSYCEGEAKMMKVTVCCEDRPGLNRDLTQALRLVRARAVHAEMMTVGGRTKSVVEMQWADGNTVGEVEVGALKRALKAVVENRPLVAGLGHFVHGSKRARVYGSVDDGYDEF